MCGEKLNYKKDKVFVLKELTSKEAIKLWTGNYENVLSG